MIIRAFIVTLAILLAVVSARAETPIQYTEDYLIKGNVVNLTHGFYVCNIDNPRDLMADLINQPDTIKRRKLAKDRGCPFDLSFKNNAPTYKIKYLASSMCLEREKGWRDIIVNNKVVRETVDICGKEAHQFVADYMGHSVVVIFVSLDVDYD